MSFCGRIVVQRAQGALDFGRRDDRKIDLDVKQIADGLGRLVDEGVSRGDQQALAIE